MLNNNFDKLLSKKRKEFIDNFWLNLGDTSQIKTRNVLNIQEDWQRDNPLGHIVDFMRRPENFSFTCLHLFGIKLHPFQQIILRELWDRPFPMLTASRGGGKSFLLGLYSILKALFVQGSKVIITGAGFRQAKLIYEYCEKIFKDSTMFQNILSDDKMNKPTRDIDRCVFRIGSSTITAIPTGNGEKIRGLRATDLITDEFNSIDLEVFEHIMQGFGAVSASPIDNIIQISKLEALKQLGEITAEQVETQESLIKSNKSIVSGTCGFEFESFAKYWKKYKSIIESKGNIDKLAEIFNGEIPLGFNWRDYSIIRMPYDLIPKGFMDIKMIGKAKATIEKSVFLCEYGAVFAKDSLGFFKRSTIERCVCGNKLNNLPYKFTSVLRGDYKKKYVIGVDPASQHDDFTIVVLEIWPDHRRIVYAWSTNRERHKAKLKRGLVNDHDYYRYCARKIRELKKLFPCEMIAIDTQGGGYSVGEALGDPMGLADNERPIYPIIIEDEPQPTDDMVGEHIIHYIQFSDAKWVVDANHGLRKDLEDCCVIFPYYDSQAIAMALEEDKIAGRIKIETDENIEKLYDTLEDSLHEIEELKNELTLIVHTKTNNGRDRWDTPELKIGIGKKGRLRKDRYSALLMANMVAREFAKVLPEPEYKVYGGIAQQIANVNKKSKNSDLYTGPAWFMEQTRGKTFGVAVRKKGG